MFSLWHLVSYYRLNNCVLFDTGYKDITDKYKNAASLMHTIGSVATIPGIILFYVLYFSGRLKLSHIMREDNS